MALGLNFKIWGFLSRGLGIFIPGIGDFFKPGDFYRRDWGSFKPGFIFLILRFLSPRIGNLFKSGDSSRGLRIFIPGIWDFRKSGDFYPQIPGIFAKSTGFFGMRIFFFVGWDIPPRSHLCFLIIFEEWLKIGNQLSRVNFFQSKEFFVKILISIIGVKMQCPKNRFYGLWSSRRSPVGVHTFEGFQKLHD